MTFETAAEHATRRVPVVEATQHIGEVRQLLTGERYDCASHIVVCEGEKFVGLVTIEDLLADAADARVDSLMDREAPMVAPGVDQEVAAWRGAPANPRWPSSITMVGLSESFRRTGCSAFFSPSTKRTSPVLVGF